MLPTAPAALFTRKTCISLALQKMRGREVTKVHSHLLRKLTSNSTRYLGIGDALLHPALQGNEPGADRIVWIPALQDLCDRTFNNLVRWFYACGIISIQVTIC
jgi:hypothetical protein